MSEYQPLAPPANGTKDQLYGYILYDAQQAQHDTNEENLWEMRGRLLECLPLRCGPGQLAWVATFLPTCPTVLVYFAVYSAERRAVVGTASGSNLIPKKADIEEIAKTLGMSGEPMWVEDDASIFPANGSNVAGVLQAKAHEQWARELAATTE
ncbi:hypothetical protein MKEN_01060400 [Mycena kentingensis (nom. inval.)]|nr:hypothetical protein MKEN_01060400 [Mycena kentingensis (nom. inval.)]